jgi:DNA repair protein SbcC/Rad50
LQEPIHIDGLTIEGFRGINALLPLEFNGKSILITGKNGVGKSTILQAIEWCLLGKCAYMDQDEFGMEDAIVNMFHPDKKARVTMRLTDGKRHYELTRERKMGKTTRGKSDLLLKGENVNYEGPEAETRAAEILGISPEQFYAATYLRQESIRDFVVGDANTRSKVVDELLGLETLRQLSECLPLKEVDNAVGKVQKDVKDIEEGKIQALELARKKLTDYTEELKKKGFTGKKLTTGNLVLMTTSIADELTDTTRTMKIPPPKLETPEENLLSMSNCHKQLSNCFQAIDEKRFDVFEDAQRTGTALQKHFDKYVDALDRLTEFKEKDPKQLQEKLNKAKERQQQAESERDEEADLVVFLDDRKTTLKGLTTDSTKAKGKLKKLMDKFGSIEQIQKNVKDFDEQIKNETKRKKEIGAYTQLLKSAVDYLGEAKPNKCPICKKPIEYGTLRKELLSHIGKSEEENIARIDEKIDELKDSKKEHNDAAEDIGDFEKEIKGLDSQLLSEAQDVEKRAKIKLKKPFEDQLTKLIGNLKDSGKKLDDKARAFKDSASEIEAQLKPLKKALDDKQDLTKKIQELLGTKESEAKLKETLERRIKDQESEVDKLKKLGDRFPSIRDMLSTFKEILEYLVEEERVRKLDEEIPGAKERIDELNKQSEKLQELFTGLSDISEALKMEKDSILKSTLDELQSDVSGYYSRMLAHPYFVNVQLTPEKEKKGSVYRIVAFDDSKNYSTYVQTRFSNAQTNVTALSLFLAMAGATTSRLGLLIMDDPGQSLDPEHKRALAEILADEAKEKQIILATQDEEITNLVVEATPKTQFKSIIIQSWTPQSGPKLGH